jgi:hypothetical protein
VSLGSFVLLLMEFLLRSHKNLNNGMGVRKVPRDCLGFRISDKTDKLDHKYT